MSASYRLYHYWRSSSSWRVRWALALKGIEVEWAAVNLLKGEDKSPEHQARSPMGLIPVLEFLHEKDPQRRFLTESMAILEWLEGTVPQKNPLLPADLWMRAKARQLAELINAGTQPLQGLKTMQKVSSVREEQVAWAKYWTEKGLAAYEKTVAPVAGKFSLGNSVTLPDLFLVPQCYNALRFEVELKNFPTIHRIYGAARETAECQASDPEAHQPPEA